MSARDRYQDGQGINMMQAMLRRHNYKRENQKQVSMGLTWLVILEWSVSNSDNICHYFTNK